MYSYPLKFRVDLADEYSGSIRVIDHDKEAVLFRQSLDDATLEGNKPYWVYRDEQSSQRIYQIQYQELEETAQFLLSNADGAPLGSVVRDEYCDWKILDAYGSPQGSIELKNGWRRSCLFTLVSGGALDAFLYLIWPLRYELRINEQKVLVLQETDFSVNDVYILKKTSDLDLSNEPFLLLSLMSMFWPLG